MDVQAQAPDPPCGGRVATREQYLPIDNDNRSDDVVYQEIQGGTSLTFIPEDDVERRPVTVHVRHTGRNRADVLSIYGRRLGGERDEFWHQNPTTGRWRSGKPRRETLAA